MAHKGDPAAVRSLTIGVRVTEAEYALLQEKGGDDGHESGAMVAAGSARRLPSPTGPAINSAEYGKFARVSANFNQLVRLAHEGRSVTIHEDMIRALLVEVSRLLGPARSTGVRRPVCEND